MKKAISLILAAALLCSLLMTAAFADETVVRLLIPGLNEQQTIDPISGIVTPGIQEIEDFFNSKLVDAKIKLVTMPWDGWIQKLEVMAKAGEMDIGFYTNQPMVPDWYEDLTAYMTGDPDLNTENLSTVFTDAAAHYSIYKDFRYPEATGKIYGLPMTMAANYIVVDKLLLEQWGYELPADGTSMHELVELAAKCTGTNPVTGEHNYGAYLTTTWMEWNALPYNAVKPMKSDDMILANVDANEYFECLKDSPEALAYMEDMLTLVNSAPASVATNTTSYELTLTEDNDVVFNFDVNNICGTYMKYVYAGDEEVTSRFVPVMLPSGEAGQSFPEFYHFAISKGSPVKEEAWKVLKQVVTNPEIIDYYISHVQTDKVPALRDTTGVTAMDNALIQRRHAWQMSTMFITDDYWYWRTPLQNVNKQLVAKQLSAEEGRTAFYNEVMKWVSDTKAQLGQ